jgi:hypothetical protein
MSCDQIRLISTVEGRTAAVWQFCDVFLTSLDDSLAMSPSVRTPHVPRSNTDSIPRPGRGGIENTKRMSSTRGMRIAVPVRERCPLGR